MNMNRQNNAIKEFNHNYNWSEVFTVNVCYCDVLLSALATKAKTVSASRPLFNLIVSDF